MKSPLSDSGNMHQASILDANNETRFNKLSSPIMLGIIQDVYTVDNTTIPNINPQGAYTLYSVELSPLGTMIQNVPAVMFGGHMVIPPDNTSGRTPVNVQLSGIETPPNSVQNIEETPYVIGQPVLVAFIGSNRFNAVIIGGIPVSTNINGATIGQTTADYPRKYGSFQGASWSIDNTGNPSLDIPSTGTLTITVGGQVFCTISNGTVNIGGDTGMQPTILGDALNTYLTNFINTYNTHTHLFPATGGAPTSQPVIPATGPSGIETTVAMVK